MSKSRQRHETARAERIVPGIWRLRIPLPWHGVPHVNAYALSAGDGIVLVDTGTGPDGDLKQIELALSQIGRGLEDISLIVCTHAHADHYGLAKPLVEATGAPFWIHPAWGHVRAVAEDPKGARLALAEESGVPEAVVAEYEAQQSGISWIAGVVEPDLELLPGVTVDTDLGQWQIHETPGHAPSHVVLHQPERRLLISGDHLLGRVSVFYERGYTPDPVSEFLTSLDRIEGLDVGLVLAGHGRPFRDPDAKVAATRQLVEATLDRVRAGLALRPATVYELLSEVAGPEFMSSSTAPYGLEVFLTYLEHLRALGEAAPQEGSDPPVWALTPRVS